MTAPFFCCFAWSRPGIHSNWLPGLCVRLVISQLIGKRKKKGRYSLLSRRLAASFRHADRKGQGRQANKISGEVGFGFPFWCVGPARFRRGRVASVSAEQSGDIALFGRGGVCNWAYFTGHKESPESPRGEVEEMKFRKMEDEVGRIN